MCKSAASLETTELSFLRQIYNERTSLIEKDSYIAIEFHFDEQFLFSTFTLLAGS